MWQVVAAIAVGSVISAHEQGKAAKRRAAAEQQAAELEAQSLESSAASELQVGEQSAMALRLRGAEVQGQARVVQGASRLEGGEDALRKTAVYTELDVATERDNARRAAWGLRERARYTRRAGAARARAAREEGRAAQVSTLIGGGMDAVGAYYGGRR